MPVRPAKPWASFVALIGAFAAVQSVAAVPAQVTDVRLWSRPEGTRLVVDLSAPVRHEVFTLDKPDRVVIDLANTELALSKGLPAGQGPVKDVRSGPRRFLRTLCWAFFVVQDLLAEKSTRSSFLNHNGQQ